MFKNILIAPQAFKGTYSATEAASQIAEGVHKVFPKAKLLLLPIADGGDGTLDLLISKLHGERVPCPVQNANGELVNAYFGKIGKSLAIVEMAKICGLAALGKRTKQIGKASSYGLGQALLAAAKTGVSEIWVCLGGSASHDAGAGMLQAVGGKLLDQQGHSLSLGPENLLQLDHIDLAGLNKEMPAINLQAACDVSNPLLGDQGAILYAAQKGAKAADMPLLTAAVSRYVHVAAKEKLAQEPFTGAAGGAAFSLAAFMQAKLYPGGEKVLDWLEFHTALQNVDLVIVGEGRLDGQTQFGKAPYAAAKRAQEQGIPTLMLAGTIENGFIADKQPYSYLASLEGYAAKSLAELAYQALKKISLI